MKYHFFYGSSSPFSNFYKSNFSIEGINFISTEQYFMYMKAITFKDSHSAEMILKSRFPMDAKSLGRKVKNYKEEEWSNLRYQIMLKGVFHKFNQNVELLTLIKSEEFNNVIFVEASPTDRIWGIGMDKDDPDVQDERKWRGKNLLGKVINEVRAMIVNYPRLKPSGFLGTL